MNYQQDLVQRLNNKEAAIGIVGLGYVGLPLMLCYTNQNYKVIGFDIDAEKIQALNQGQSYIGHIAHDKIKTAKEQGFEATTDFSRVKDVDALILCVPTPLNQFREPDLSYVINTVDNIAPYCRAGQVISLESTTYPGTTEEELKPRLEKQGLTVGEDIFLVFSPEREDPANKHYHTGNIPKVCGGSTPACLEAGKSLYQHIISKVVPVSSTKVAEMTKLLENIHRAVNIGLVNELKIVADKMGIDILEVIDAAATKPFGFVPYYPGPGLGGHCIPIDPFYLTWKAREYGIHTRFIELAGEINSNMPDWVLHKIMNGLNDHGKSLRGSKILVIGIAYKEDVDDARESPGIKILDMLKSKGATVNYHDNYFPEFPPMREYNFDLSSLAITADNIQAQDAVVIATAHKNVDYQLIANHAALIIDTRAVYRDQRDNVIRA